MATFYLLPPRDCLEAAMTGVLARLLPGLPVPADVWDLVLVQLAANSGWSKDLYLISRDELPDGEPIADSLRIHFGAETGDRVVEVPLSRFTAAGTGSVRSWTLEPVAVSVTSGMPYNHITPEPFPPSRNSREFA